MSTTESDTPPDGLQVPTVLPPRMSSREIQILTLIVQGLSNQEIADAARLSINSVKTYIRTAYKKMGVTRRSQAVTWAVQHGFEPPPSGRE
ncbi:LuxR C-terminal-related transcriptional regulator [Nocardioides sp. 503]|uniref:response regulator transcription factor n=1 Tax=Nocardioides sp. 503 TaxID=2508326 RepID=UPI001FD71342|nr:LuxR C-terminal-related transcriptional regulator [Nocardioides sp. 503]